MRVEGSQIPTAEGKMDDWVVFDEIETMNGFIT